MAISDLSALLVEFLDQIFTKVTLDNIFVVMAAAAGAFGGGYLRKRGENRAMNEQFEIIRKQLQITTSDTEKIKQQLSVHAWRSQQQWSACEQYYSKLLTHLHHFRLALNHLSDYYLIPGSEHTSDHEQGERFHRLQGDASSSSAEIHKLIGPAAIFLSSQAVESLNHLVSELTNIDAICTADYVYRAKELAETAYEQVLYEAKAQLGEVTQTRSCL